MSVWKFIENSEGPVAFLYVTESRGSSPGRAGFKMAIRPDGTMAGSIGGGIMEQNLVEWALDRLRSGNHDTVQRRQIHRAGEGEDHSGLICSGEQTVIFTVIESHNFNPVGYFTLSTTGAGQSTSKPEGEFLAVEPFDSEKTIYIIGGGHVGLALSRTMSQLDFRVEVFDDRTELNTVHRNEFADVIHKQPLTESLPQIPEGDQSWVVAVTFGIAVDRTVLEILRNKTFRYFGLMGSEAKIRKLREEFGPLAGIQAPVGISINSQTPEEIAISIAAAIIQEKNRL